MIRRSLNGETHMSKPDEIVTPLETLRGMRQLRDDLTEAINEIENENNRNDMGYVQGIL